MLNFEVLESGWAVVSAPHFACNFSKKLFLMLYSIN